MFCFVRETWSHVIEMLRRYWLEVCFFFFTIFCCWLLLVVSSFFVFLAFLLIVECYPEKKFEILYHVCHRLCFSYEKLGWFCVRLVYKFLVPSFSYEFLAQETWIVCHQHKKCGDMHSQSNNALVYKLHVALCQVLAADH